MAVIVTGLENEGTDNSGRRTGHAAQVSLDIDGKQIVLDEATLRDLVGKGEEYGRIKEGITPLLNLAAKYGVTDKEYLANAEASFALANALIEKGIIDQQGNIIEKTPASNVTFMQKATESTGGKANEVVLAALNKLTERLETLESGQSSMWKRTLEQDVKAQYPNLDPEDVPGILAKSKSDKSKSFWDHAQVVSKEKETRRKESETSAAKEVVGALIKAGIIPVGTLDVDKLDLSQLKEIDPSDTSKSYVGKKFIFDARKQRLKNAGVDVSGFASPRAAMVEVVGKKYKFGG